MVDLRTSNLRYVVAGLVFEASARDNSDPVAEARIEVELDISDPARIRLVHFRYVTEE